jgi:hypothetical protein
MPPRHVPHHPPAQLRPQPRPSPQSSANPPTSSAGAGRRIGHLFWRVRSFPSRFAAGRSRPPQETFRRPTAILVDPATTSAASVLTDFARQSPSPKARASARKLRAAVAVGEAVSRSLPAGGNGKASSEAPTRPAEAQAALRARPRFGSFVSVCRRLRDEPPV